VLGLHLHEYELTKHGIPEIIDVLISALINHSEYLKLEGIFRKSAAISKEIEVETILAKRYPNHLINFR
jgi:hypothetical protein